MGSMIFIGLDVILRYQGSVPVAAIVHRATGQYDPAVIKCKTDFECKVCAGAVPPSAPVPNPSDIKILAARIPCVLQDSLGQGCGDALHIRHVSVPRREMLYRMRADHG